VVNNTLNQANAQVQLYLRVGMDFIGREFLLATL
jgi:hypothetical protein